MIEHYTSSSTARHPNIIPARSKVEEDIVSLMARRNCHSGMRIMGREDVFMFILEVNIQNKSRAGDICQIASGKWKLSL